MKGKTIEQLMEREAMLRAQLNSCIGKDGKPLIPSEETPKVYAKIAKIRQQIKKLTTDKQKGYSDVR